jgi:hypothetical protein
MRQNPIYVVDLMSKVVDSLNANRTAPDSQVHYMYGHPIEIVNNLTKKGKSGLVKYPLIALFLDFDEKHTDLEAAFEVNLHLIIATATTPDKFAPDRYTTNFKKILYPIYDELIYQISRSGLFMETSEFNIHHTKTDRLYWGKTPVSGNTANTANDFIDAIEITNLTLNVLKINC